MKGEQRCFEKIAPVGSRKTLLTLANSVRTDHKWEVRTNAEDENWASVSEVHQRRSVPLEH